MSRVRLIEEARQPVAAPGGSVKQDCALPRPDGPGLSERRPVRRALRHFLESAPPFPDRLLLPHRDGDSFLKRRRVRCALTRFWGSGSPFPDRLLLPPRDGVGLSE